MSVIPLHPERPLPLPTEPAGAPTRLTVVGDALLDIDIRGEVERICPDSPVPVLDERDELARPGGAALTAVLAARAGAEVTLVTALGRDAAGLRLARLLEAEGVVVCDLGLAGPTPEKVRLVAAGQRLLRLDRGGGPSPVEGRSMGEAAAAVAAGHAVVVSDYGRGLVAHGPLLERRADRLGHAQVFDQHGGVLHRSFGGDKDQCVIGLERRGELPVRAGREQIKRRPAQRNRGHGFPLQAPVWYSLSQQAPMKWLYNHSSSLLLPYKIPPHWSYRLNCSDPH